MRGSRTIVASVLLAGALLPAGAGAASIDTFLVEAFAAVPIDIQPGLCAPGDTTGCVGPEVAQFRLILGPSSTCFYNGVFEGEQLPVNASCGFELFGFMEGLAPGTKPACGAARFYTSNETSAFGEGMTNVLVINGVARSISIERMSLGGSVVFTKVEIDDADADLDPTGDHTEIVPPAPVLRQSGSSGVSCVTQPLSQALLLAGGGLIL